MGCTGVEELDRVSISAQRLFHSSLTCLRWAPIAAAHSVSVSAIESCRTIGCDGAMTLGDLIGDRQMKKPPHKRPIGESGPIRVTHSGDDPLVTWLRIRFPSDKAAQEMMIASAFAKELSAKEGVEWSVDQLREYDLDFLLRSKTEQRYLELQEIIIPPPKRGLPYASREQVIKSGKFADTIMSNIRKKAFKYPKALGRVLDLMIYNTHWRFLPNRIVLQLVAFALASIEHPFSRVYQLSMISETQAAVETIFPAGKILSSFNYIAARATRYVNFDPALSEPIKTPDGSIGVELRLDPGTVKNLFGRKSG